MMPPPHPEMRSGVVNGAKTAPSVKGPEKRPSDDPSLPYNFMIRFPASSRSAFDSPPNLSPSAILLEVEEIG